MLNRVIYVKENFENISINTNFSALFDAAHMCSWWDFILGPPFCFSFIYLYLYKQYKLITTGIKWNNQTVFFFTDSSLSLRRKKKADLRTRVDISRGIRTSHCVENWERNDKDERNFTEIWRMRGWPRSSLAIDALKTNLITLFNVECEVSRLIYGSECKDWNFISYWFFFISQMIKCQSLLPC